jgi:hypothetical protein
MWQVVCWRNIRQLCDRCKEHERDEKKALEKRKKNQRRRSTLPSPEEMNKKPKETALSYHVHISGHVFDFDSKKILKKVRNFGTIKIQEANQIIRHEGEVVNYKTDAKHVSPFFYNLIKRSKDHCTRKKKRRSVNPPSMTSGTEPDMTLSS